MPRRLMSAATPDVDKPDSHRKKKILRSNMRDACTTEERVQKKRKWITPCPSPPVVGVPLLNEFDRLVASVTQSPLASSTAAVGQSPRRSPRLLKVPRLGNFEVISKKKVQVQGFKLDDTAIHAWIRNDCDLFPTASASSLKIKAQNNFESAVQRKPRLVMACPGQSQRIAAKSQSDKPTKTKAKSKSKPPPAVIPPSIPSTSTIESNSLRRYLLEDFLFLDVGDTLLLQIALDHPLHASYSALYKRSGPKPLRIASGHTFLQIPCVVTLCLRPRSWVLSRIPPSYRLLLASPTRLLTFPGKRVEGYMLHLQMATEFICQQKYLSSGRQYG
jgi:hypothetical protein